ncbi:hypothetical protein ACIBUR_28690 [Streptomyces anulatus]
MSSHFSPPIDLSALANYRLADVRPRRSVFIGRVSTKDNNQNPSSSIPRQVKLASERLEEGEQFAAHFWDVESGMLPPELRGRGPQEMYDALAVPTPRDGGLQDLVDRAEDLGVHLRHRLLGGPTKRLFPVRGAPRPSGHLGPPRGVRPCPEHPDAPGDL